MRGPFHECLKIQIKTLFDHKNHFPAAMPGFDFSMRSGGLTERIGVPDMNAQLSFGIKLNQFGQPACGTIAANPSDAECYCTLIIPDVRAPFDWHGMRSTTCPRRHVSFGTLLFIILTIYRIQSQYKSSFSQALINGVFFIIDKENSISYDDIKMMYTTFIRGVSS